MSLMNVPQSYAERILEASLDRLPEKEAGELRSKVKGSQSDRGAALQALADLHPGLAEELQDDWPFDTPCGVEVYNLDVMQGYTPADFAKEVGQVTKQTLTRRVTNVLDRAPDTPLPHGWVRRLNWREEGSIHVDVTVRRRTQVGRGEFKDYVETRAAFVASIVERSSKWSIDVFATGAEAGLVIRAITRDLLGGSSSVPARAKMTRDAVDALAAECNVFTDLAGPHPDGEHCEVAYKATADDNGNLVSLNPEVIKSQLEADNDFFGYGLSRAHRFGWIEQVVWNASFTDDVPKLRFRNRTSRRGVQYVVDRLYGRA